MALASCVCMCAYLSHQAARTVARSENVQRLTEAAAAASAAIEALEQANRELEDKLRAKDKKIETLTQARGEAEAHLRVRVPCCSAYSALLKVETAVCVYAFVWAHFRAGSICVYRTHVHTH